MEENYDDVDEMKAKVEEINNAEAKNAEPICEESYDDLDTVAEQAREHLHNGKLVVKNILGEFLRANALSQLDSRSRVLSSNPVWGHCIVFLDKTLSSHISSPRPVE